MWDVHEIFCLDYAHFFAQSHSQLQVRVFVQADHQPKVLRSSQYHLGV